MADAAAVSSDDDEETASMKKRNRLASASTSATAAAADTPSSSSSQPSSSRLEPSSSASASTSAAAASSSSSPSPPAPPLHPRSNYPKIAGFYQEGGIPIPNYLQPFPPLPPPPPLPLPLSPAPALFRAVAADAHGRILEEHRLFIEEVYHARAAELVDGVEEEGEEIAGEDGDGDPQAQTGNPLSQHKRSKVSDSIRQCKTEAADGGSVPSSISSGAQVGNSYNGPTLLPCIPYTHESFKTESGNNGTEPEGKHEEEAIELDNNSKRAEDCSSRMDLTYDLLHMVFSLLDQESLCRAAIVCRQWRSVSSHDDFWTCLNFEKHKRVTAEQVIRLCRKYPKAVELNLKNVLYDDDLVRDAMHSLQGLEKLTLGRGYLTDTFFSDLTNECPNLNQLVIVDAVLGNGGSQEIRIRHDRLVCLKVTGCRVMRIAIRCQRLLYLSLNRSSMTSALLQCPRLSKLDVSSCHKLSDAGVRAAATACRTLLHLNISQCSYVSDETLREISFVCQKLSSLNASFCPNISLEGVRMQSLAKLTLENCEGINSSSMTALSNCYKLESIKLDNCSFLMAVFLDLPYLQSISLSNCCKLADLNLRCPFLVSLNIALCPVLSRVDISSTSLQKLVMQNQQSLTTLVLQCPWVREVDLTDCESLVDTVCQVFSESGGCPRLEVLVLENCQSLTSVKLINTSLRTLTLTGCCKMENLELRCPSLDELYLDGCEYLTDAIFFPVGLSSLNLGICPRLHKLKIEAPQMTTLELKGCGVLNEAHVLCPLLQSLDASYCRYLEDNCLEAITLSCPLIESLNLASCESIQSKGLAALRRLSNLMMLDLSYTYLKDLTPILENCFHLKVLRLLACKDLEDSSLNALHSKKALPNLQELDLSYDTLGHAALEGVLLGCPHLTHVSLNGCNNIHDLDWDKQLSCRDAQDMDMDCSDGGQCSVCSTPFNPDKVWSSKLDKKNSTMPFCSSCGSPSQAILKSGGIRALQQLNCVGCPRIQKFIIPYSAGCLQLSSLNLSLSSNLKEVRLVCANLTSLNLSQCIVLEVLELSCPRLISLILQGCGIGEAELEVALRDCSLLETLDVRHCEKVSMEGLTVIRALCPRLKRLVS